MYQQVHFFNVCDECTDASNREQVVICIRWINTNLKPQEDFIGLYKADDICASTIGAIIKDTLISAHEPIPLKMWRTMLQWGKYYERSQNWGCQTTV